MDFQDLDSEHRLGSNTKTNKDLDFSQISEIFPISKTGTMNWHVDRDLSPIFKSQSNKKRNMYIEIIGNK